jgi:HSF-type DNA-binding
MKVLSDKKNAEIITWMPSGKSFNILQPKAFVADILPTHFKTAKYSSFTRKLHRWGFMRHYRGEEAGAFYHKDFQRGRLDLVEQMTCHKTDPPKSSQAISFAAAEKKALVKPAPLRAPAALPNPQPPRAIVAPHPPATPKTIKMSVLKVPTSLTTPSIRTPLVTTPSLNVNITAALPPMAPQLAAPSAMSSTTDRLNAAIELEVNRRIKERINAVALQRQAFALSALRQQQLLNPHVSSQQQMAALLLQKQACLFKTTSSIPLGAPPMGYRALAPEGEPLPGAPPTNIQGARTA